MRGWVLVLVALVVGAQEEVRFRSEVRRVRVDVAVREGGKPVKGLGKEDFVVRDEGEVVEVVEASREEQALDLLLVLDMSDSMAGMREQMEEQAREALGKVGAKDRVGVVAFGAEAVEVVRLTGDFRKVSEGLRRAPTMRGTELSRTVVLAARYLAQKALPGARRGMIVFSDNVGVGRWREEVVKRELWKADVVVSVVEFEPEGFGVRGIGPDLRKYAEWTGGDVMEVSVGGRMRLGEVIGAMRERYSLLYRAPERRAGQECRIRVEVKGEKKYEVRARRGYQAAGR